jgi:hypothetical protein
MKFSDYFKLGHDKEVADKKRADNRQMLYQLYFNYIIYDLDDYSKEANAWIVVKGYNYFSNTMDDYDAVELYVPYCFRHSTLVLVWQPLTHKMVQIWDNHVFVDGEEVGPFKYDFSKDVNGNYSKYPGLDKDQLKKFAI